jgi:hypothetical protein
MVENKVLIFGVGVLVIGALYFGLGRFDLISFFSGSFWLWVCGVAFLVLVGYLFYDNKV